MPPLPDTWKERYDAELRRRINRLQRDRRLNWTRTRRARRQIVVAAALLWGGSMLATGIASAAGATAGAIASYQAKATSGPASTQHATVSPGLKKG